MTHDSNVKIIFWGTPEFAAIILNSLIKNNYQLIAVVTAPDKPVGRHAYRQAGKQILTPPPVKTRIMNLESRIKNKIKIVQPERIKENSDFKSQISNLNPDLFIVAAYGLILPQKILDIPKIGSLNVHPSLLPKYRGASPIQATILNGDQEAGVTIILMDEKMDHGDIVANSKLKIQNSKVAYEELSKELANLGTKLLIETLPKWINGEIKPIPQDHLKATFTKIIKKQNGQINWQKSAEEIERMTRAYWPWPGTFTSILDPISSMPDKYLKIIKVDILKINHDKQPGTIFLAENKKLVVACGQNAVILEEIQLEGKKPMTAKEFINGHPKIIGAQLI